MPVAASASEPRRSQREPQRPQRTTQNGSVASFACDGLRELRGSLAHSVSGVDPRSRLQLKQQRSADSGTSRTRSPSTRLFDGSRQDRSLDERCPSPPRRVNREDRKESRNARKEPLKMESFASFACDGLRELRGSLAHPVSGVDPRSRLQLKQQRSADIGTSQTRSPSTRLFDGSRQDRSLDERCPSPPRRVNREDRKESRNDRKEPLKMESSRALRAMGFASFAVHLPTRCPASIHAVGCS